MALAVTTDAVTDIFHNIATGNGEVTDDNGGQLTERGFVMDTSSHGDPGNTAPEDSDYPTKISEGSDASPVYVERGEVSMAAGVDTTVTVNLTTPVPVGKSFPILSMRASATEPSRTHATATLMTDVSGFWTQLRIQRSFSTSTDAVYRWEVLHSDAFTVQTAEVTMTGNTEVDTSISAVDLSKTFLVLTMRSNSTSAIAAYNRAKFTSTTNVRINSGSSTTSQIARFYAVTWEGATVQSGESVYSGAFGTINETITTVDRTKSFVIYSWSMLNFGSNPGIVATRAALSSDTNLQFFKSLQSASEHGTICWFVVSHPNINVQYGTTTLTGADSGGTDITAVDDLDRTFLPTPFQGNANQTTNANSSLHHAYNTREMTDADTITTKRGNNTNNLTSSWFVVENQVVTFAEEVYDLPLSGLSPETTYYVRAFCLSSGDYAYGDEVNFTTDASPFDAQRGSAAHLLMMM